VVGSNALRRRRAAPEITGPPPLKDYAASRCACRRSILLIRRFRCQLSLDGRNVEQAKLRIITLYGSQFLQPV